MDLNFKQAISCYSLTHSVIITLASLTNQCLQAAIDAMSRGKKEAAALVPGKQYRTTPKDPREDAGKMSLPPGWFHYETDDGQVRLSLPRTRQRENHTYYIALLGLLLQSEYKYHAMGQTCGSGA